MATPKCMICLHDKYYMNRNIFLNNIFNIYILWVTMVCSVIDNSKCIELEKFFCSEKCHSPKDSILSS